MSVDAAAKIGYGYILSNDEYQNYMDKIENINDANYMTLEDYCCYINNYATDSDVFCGLILSYSDYYEPISMDISKEIDLKDWEDFINIFKKELPDVAASEIPQMYLICEWW